MTEVPTATPARDRAATRFARHLHPRRVIAWVLLAPALGAVAWLMVAPTDLGTRLAVIAVAALGAATLADYVPVAGRRLDVGCEPCAVAAGLSVPAGVVLIVAVAPVIGVLVAAAGLAQRLRQPDTCPT